MKKIAVFASGGGTDFQSVIDVKKQGNYFANKGLYSQSYDFSSNHAWL